MPPEMKLQSGMTHLRAGDFAAAERDFRAVLKADARNLAALNLLAVALMQQRRFADAEPFLKAALAIDPAAPAAHGTYAAILNALSRPQEALGHFETALAAAAHDAGAWNGRGLALGALGRLDEAAASFERAVALQPAYADAWFHLGEVLARAARFEPAAAAFDKAIALQPNRYDAYFGRANALQQSKRYAEAAAVYNRILAVDPQQVEALAQSLLCELQVCDWSGYDAKTAALAKKSDAGDLPVTPFALLPVPMPRTALRRAAETFIRDEYPPAPQPLWRGERYGHDRIRLGYVSTDFHNHPVAQLIAELFERHDRSRFEVSGLSIGGRTDDAMRQRIAGAFDRFHDVAGQASATIASLVRTREIDVLVDLNGFTAGYRPDIFARRPAPVQVNYLGFPSTMGAPYIDYIVADPVLIPPSHFDGYTEKVVHLPDTFQVNDTTKAIAAQVPPRSALGLPEDGFVFCCFNNSYKLTPDVFDIWMRLLARVPGSVLWLRQDSEAIKRSLIGEAGKRGIDAARLVFAPRTPTLADHLARHARADLFVDTFHYNAHTTASDALWAGLPLVTCIGETYPSRVAASLLHAVGLPELVTASHAAYEKLILDLAADRERLAAIRARLAMNIRTCPLFDIGGFTRHLEDAYTQMWQRAERGERPDHIVVAP